MSTGMWLVILLTWTVAGLFVAIVFGRMNQGTDLDQEEVLPESPKRVIKYLRRNQRKTTARLSSRDAIRRIVG
jgi:hypothetical protein